MVNDLDLCRETVAGSLKMYTERDIRVGMRSGMMDAAHLCDAIAEEILGSRRKSRERDALCAAVKRCGDAIENMRNLVAT